MSDDDMSPEAVLAFDEVLSATVDAALATPQEDLEQLTLEELLDRVIRQAPVGQWMPLFADWLDAVKSVERGGRGRRERLAVSLLDSTEKLVSEGELQEVAALWAVNWAPSLDPERWDTLADLAYGMDDDEAEELLG